MKKTFSIFLYMLLCCAAVFAQDKERRQYRLNLSAGAALQSARDLSLSPNLYNGINYRFLGGYEAGRAGTAGGIMLNAQLGNISYKVPGYSARQMQVLKFGADAVKTWRVHQQNKTEIFAGPLYSLLINGRIPYVADNNFTGYEIANSIGITGKVNRTFSLKSRELILSNGLNLPLLSHLIRPAYTGPYPVGFLEDGVFNTNGEVTAGPVLRSGKIVTLNRFFKLDNYLTLTYPLKKNGNALRLTYNWEFYKASLHGETAWVANQSLFFTLLTQL